MKDIEERSVKCRKVLIKDTQIGALFTFQGAYDRQLRLKVVQLNTLEMALLKVVLTI